MDSSDRIVLLLEKNEMEAHIEPLEYVLDFHNMFIRLDPQL